MRKIFLAIAVFLLLAISPPSFGYGREGHDIVFQIALLRLKSQSPSAYAQVLRILNGESIPSAANWLDAVKNQRSPYYSGYLEKGPNQDATRQFLSSKVTFDTTSWHFTLIPVEVRDYGSGEGELYHGSNTRPDAVQATKLCIRTLEGHPDLGWDLQRVNALRAAIHLVADLHQPLHVAEAFADLHADSDHHVELQWLPTSQNVEDFGGKTLWIPSRHTSLHSLWDKEFVEAVAGKYTDSPVKLAQQANKLMSQVEFDQNWLPKDQSPDKWPEAWCIETHLLSQYAYQGLSSISSKPHSNRIVVNHIEPDYDERAKSIIRIELVKAGYRLAYLLQTLFSTGPAKASSVTESPTARANTPRAGYQAVPPSLEARHLHRREHAIVMPMSLTTNCKVDVDFPKLAEYNLANYSSRDEPFHVPPKNYTPTLLRKIQKYIADYNIFTDPDAVFDGSTWITSKYKLIRRNGQCFEMAMSVNISEQDNSSYHCVPNWLVKVWDGATWKMVDIRRQPDLENKVNEVLNQVVKAFVDDQEKAYARSRAGGGRP